jgi:hypothetical protein
MKSSDSPPPVAERAIHLLARKKAGEGRIGEKRKNKPITRNYRRNVDNGFPGIEDSFLQVAALHPARLMCKAFAITSIQETHGNA